MCPMINSEKLIEVPPSFASIMYELQPRKGVIEIYKIVPINHE